MANNKTSISGIALILFTYIFILSALSFLISVYLLIWTDDKESTRVVMKVLGTTMVVSLIGALATYEYISKNK